MVSVAGLGGEREANHLDRGEKTMINKVMASWDLSDLLKYLAGLLIPHHKIKIAHGYVYGL